MATAPVKSPLHNFPLTFLKWGGAKNHTSGGHHRCRRPISAESSPVADHGELHPERNDSEPESSRPSVRVGSRTSRNRFGFASCSLAPKEKEEQVSNESDEAVAREGKKQHQRREGEEAEAEETVQKPWNLRPRKVLFSKAATAPMGQKNGEFQEPAEGSVAVSGGQHQSENQNQPKSMRLRGFTEQQSTEKKEKRKFWIALSREEIEEDIFAMTGSRPARRPPKRPKNIQKQLDTLFPGLWLVGVTADSYRVADAPPKR